MDACTYSYSDATLFRFANHKINIKDTFHLAQLCIHIEFLVTLTSIKKLHKFNVLINQKGYYYPYGYTTSPVFGSQSSPVSGSCTKPSSFSIIFFFFGFLRCLSKNSLSS